MQKNVLIVTLGLGKNYGGILQAFALQHAVKNLGFNVTTAGSSGSSMRKHLKKLPFAAKVIEKIKGPRLVESPLSSTTFHTNKFINKYINKKTIDSARIAALCSHYDAIITGSDQVWRKKYAYLPHTFLLFPAPRTRKFSFAASFGREDIKEYNLIDKALAKRQLRSFKSISVREKSGSQLVQRLAQRSAESHLDPTLLLTKSDYCEILPSERIQDGPFLFNYCLDPTPAKTKAKETLSEVLKLPSFTLILGENNHGTPLPSVESWLSAFRDAEMVLTDSFHGTIFSIIFNKPFLVFGNHERGLSRFTSLLGELGLLNHLVDEDSSTLHADIQSIISASPNWEEVEAHVAARRKKALRYLRENITKMT